MDNSFLIDLLLKLKSGEKPDMMTILLPLLIQSMNKPEPEKPAEKTLENFEIIN